MQRTIFMDIIEGKIPAFKVYEDDKFLAFLDAFPRAVGHTLVIPKKPYRWVYEVPNFEEYWGVVRKVTTGIQMGIQPIWLSYLTVGLEVPHAHIHILPRFTPTTHNVASYPDQIKMSKEGLKETADKIILAMK
jgi:histidine triad (HIT) family protein